MLQDENRVCEYCGISYLNVYTAKAGVKTKAGYRYTTPTRFCSKSCAGKSRGVNHNHPPVSPESLREECLSFIRSEGRYCTGLELVSGTNHSCKTFTKCGLSVVKLNEEVGFSKPKSKFQQDVGNILRSKFEDVLEEHTFDDLRGPTGAKLRVDFYVPSENLVVEADGGHHYQESHPYRTWATGSVETSDRIKEEFCDRNYISLVRVRYTRKVIESAVIEEIVSSCNI